MIGSVLLALAGALALSAQPPQPGQPVSLYVTVEKKGDLVQGLGPQDFRLSEEDQPRRFVMEPPETPISVALLVENSRASYYYWNDIEEALRGFLANAPEGNWYALATYANELNINVDFTQQRGKIEQGMSDIGQPLWNEVDTYDAVWQVLDKMGQLPGRKVLIVVGSGFDTFSGHSLDDVQKKLESVNVVVYAAGTGSTLRGFYEPYLGTNARLNLLQARAFLQMLADKSGGEAWFPMFEGAFPDVMKGIFQSLQNQYRLVYVPAVPADGKLHKIKVEAFTINDDKREDFKVRVREGWRF